MTYRPPDRATTSRPFNPMLVVGALIGAAVIVAVVIFALSQRDDGSVGDASGGPTASLPASDAPAPSASTSPSASAQPEPSEAAGPPTIAWEEPAAFDGEPEELMVDGETWVAVGWSAERGPGAWTSPDAREWERAEVVDPQPDDTFRGAGLGPTVRLGDSLLSFGTFIGCCDGRGIHAWRSADGRSWEVIESDSPLFETGYVVTELVVGDPALVAVEGRYAGFTGRFWRWTEETSWVETTPGTAGTEDPSGIQTEDVAWADGRFVVVGTRGDPMAPGPVTGTSWTSADGQSWEESSPGGELESIALLQVAPMPGGGFAALGASEAGGSGNDGVPVAFTSPDGLSWTPVKAPPAEPNVRPTEIIMVDGGLVALGSDMTTTTFVWTSADGNSWTDAGRLDFVPMAAAALGDQLVVITADYDPAEPDGGYLIHRGSLD